MKSLNHQSLLQGLLKYVVSIAIIAYSTIGANCNSASGQKASSGGEASGSFTFPRGGGGGGSTLLLLVAETAFPEGATQGISYACLQTARDTRFAYFCLIDHKYSEDTDEIPYSVHVRDERGEVKQSFKIADKDVPISYAITVNTQAKAVGDKETLKVNGTDVDLDHGRLLLIETTRNKFVVRQAAIPAHEFPKNGLRENKFGLVSEEVDQLTARITRDVNQSLRDGTLKTRMVSETK
ncbi:MAG TPA: hypothetical protein VGN12_08645 [Pirellulales bacterium]|jgi:hypothetical protein